MGQFGIGQAITRFEDRRLLRGGGRYLDDVNLPGQAHAVIVRSLHAHADPGRRHRGGARGAGRARRVHRRRRRRPRHHADDAQAQAARRLADVRAAAPRARRRTACATSATRSPWWSPRRGPRPRTPPSCVRDRLRAPALRDRRRRRPSAAPPVWDECPDNVSNLFEAGDRAATDAAFAGAAPRGAPALRHHPRARAVHGAARRARRLGPGRGALHALRRRAVSAPRAERARHQHLQGPRAPDPRHRRRRRRRLRHQGLAVPRAPAGAVGGAQAGPAR